MPKIIKIAAADIGAALTGTTRQYFCGNLKRPQRIAHYHNEQLEIGLTRYGQFTVEPTHTHSVALEFQYMVAGRTVYLDHADMTEHCFARGDFYTIEPGVTYSQKSEPGTEIIFIKIPSINDKTSVADDQATTEWFARPIETES